ncbi:uncharacterized protein LOC121383910 [Gigantopelta aegis]|uniref:uncharacterized protein LOC121383910 n=1 Tax=Gigantopelta aegis TaxID=1735272 RepID=UPI001B88A068|nr:uncharacterized protein LOC121383910 [Gigantopelta aegis]
MFDELLARVGPRITKQQTWYREPLEPGMKLALTLCHLASGSKYASMKFGWRVPHNTQSLLVREVCQAIIDEYMDKTGSMYNNYKGFYSVVLMALVDADYKFIWADVSGTGSASDAQIYNDSELKECAKDGTIGFPDPDPLPNEYNDVPYFFISDDAFAL